MTEEVLKELIQSQINIYKAGSIAFENKLPKDKELTEEKIEKIFNLSYERISESYKNISNSKELRKLIKDVVREEIDKVM